MSLWIKYSREVEKTMTCLRTKKNNNRENTNPYLIYNNPESNRKRH